MLALRIAGCLAMKEGGQMAPPRTPALLPLALLFVPKCPLCVLPLFAAFGSVLPPAPVLDAFVGAIALAWLAVAAGIGGALVLFAGRRLDLPLAGWSGALLMAGVALSVRARKIRRQRLERAASPDACGPEGCR